MTPTAAWPADADKRQSRVRVLRLALTLFALLMILGSSIVITHDDHGKTKVLGERSISAGKPAPAPSGDSTCDVDGVGVNYDTVYRPTPLGRYYVGSAVVTDISQPSCAGATLTVLLSKSPTDFSAANQLGSANAPIANGATTVLVNFATPGIKADAVQGVHVTLAGGTFPVPSQCASMTFNFVYTGTSAGETLTGTNQNDIMFGEAGNDVYNPQNGNDCIDGGNGDNRVSLGSGSSQVVLGTGTNTITGGNGAGTGNGITAKGHSSPANSTPGSTPVTSISLGNSSNGIDVGAGNSVVQLGNGNNTVKLGVGNSRVSAGNGDNTITIADGKNVVTVGNGKNTITTGAGNDTIYLGTGKNKINGGGGTNVCHIPSGTKASNETIVGNSCTVVSP